MVNGAHPWILTGPWYRWSDPCDPAVGRAARPVFQKFDGSDFVNGFLKDPQRSLKFLDPEDLTAPGGVRKLYLDGHKRFYLVVCELHCDLPGFPNASRDDVCEAGFVVRRRIPRVPQEAAADVRKWLRDSGLHKARLAQLEALPHGMKAGTLGQRARLAERQAALESELRLFTEEFGLRLVLEGWIPGPPEGVGSWQEVPETPQKITEQILPLYPLIPDPRLRNHSGGGRTIYFGVLPTGSADVDAAGNPRLDERHLYEARCFVRRHQFPCPKRPGRNDCKGELVWSKRTESYQLANPFDLTGTSNRPVNIFLPDIPALEAAAGKLKPGEGAPVRMIAPAGSNLEFSVDPASLSVTKKPPGAAICSFSIPLITIVANFVFRLFLPVVTFLFGLWFLLRLKFCIPPSLDLGAGLAADLNVALGKIEAGVDVNVAIDAGLFGQLQGLTDPFSNTQFGDMRDPDNQPLDKGALAGLAAAQSTDFSADVPAGLPVDPAPAGAIAGRLPDATARRQYEARVEVCP
jgi:hypothetical protein